VTWSVLLKARVGLCTQCSVEEWVATQCSYLAAGEVLLTRVEVSLSLSSGKLKLKLGKLAKLLSRLAVAASGSNILCSHAACGGYGDGWKCSSVLAIKHTMCAPCCSTISCLDHWTQTARSVAFRPLPGSQGSQEPKPLFIYGLSSAQALFSPQVSALFSPQVP